MVGRITPLLGPGSVSGEANGSGMRTVISDGMALLHGRPRTGRGVNCSALLGLGQIIGPVLGVNQKT